MASAPAPAVGLVALLTQALDTGPRTLCLNQTPDSNTPDTKGHHQPTTCPPPRPHPPPSQSHPLQLHYRKQESVVSLVAQH
jgi:hypothetical protein